MGLIGIVSAVNIVSLVLLCRYLLHHGTKQGRPLIYAGIVLWVTNVLLFGLWYWELDRGGPLSRALTPDAPPDFLFPQMTDPKFAPSGGCRAWSTICTCRSPTRQRSARLTRCRSRSPRSG